MAEENEGPFCSRATRCESGVLELKNFSQFAVICATADELPEPDDDAGAEDAGADTGGADDDDADELDDEAELLQAPTASASARPSAGTTARRVTDWNRIACP